MKLIKIEEVINERTISGTTDKSNDCVYTEPAIPTNAKGKDTKANTEFTVVKIVKKPKRNKIELFPFGRKASFIIFGLLIFLSVSIAYLCVHESRRIWFRWDEFYLISLIIFSVGFISYGIAVWRKNDTFKLINNFKPQFGKGFNRLLTISFIFIPWIVSLTLCIDDKFKDFLSALLIVYAIECILYISILWVYKGFEEERKENKEKESNNNITKEL